MAENCNFGRSGLKSWAVLQPETDFDPIQTKLCRGLHAFEAQQVAFESMEVLAHSKLGGLHVGKVGLHGGDVGAHRLETFLHQFIRDLGHYSL
jgi:hypothetical protein